MNKKEAIGIINMMAKINEDVIKDDVIAGCDRTTDGWIRCHKQVMEVLINELHELIYREEEEF